MRESSGKEFSVMKKAVSKFGRRASRYVARTVALSVGCLLATAAFASEGGDGVHHGISAAQLKDFGWRLLCFAALVALLAWAAKKANVKGLLAARQDAIEKALREAAEAREAAERRHLEYSEKLEKASQEIDEIYAAIKQETETEKSRILAEARVTAERIREQAESAARQEVQKARQELRDEAARLSVELAAQALKEKVGKSDQDRFVNDFVSEYLTKVEKPH
jgi:F-type H+-transporting ATPase subunit b